MIRPGGPFMRSLIAHGWGSTHLSTPNPFAKLASQTSRPLRSKLLLLPFAAFLRVLCAFAFSFAFSFVFYFAFSFVFSFVFYFESATYKIIPQKQPKTRLSSPCALTKSRNLNKPSHIHAKKSWRDYPLPSAILKLGSKRRDPPTRPSAPA